MTRFSIDSFQIFDDGMGSAVSLRNVNQASHTLGLNVTSPSSGNTYEDVAFITSQNTEFNLQALALEQLLDLISIHTGLCVSNTTNSGLKLFGQGHDPCGTNGRVSGSNNMMVTIGDAHLLITGIEATNGADAVATVRAIALSDGGAVPMACVFNAALPSSPVLDEVFTLGPTQVGNVALANDTVRSWSLDTGIEIQVLQDAGSIYPSVIVITKVMPTIRIVTDNPALLVGSVPILGLACTNANSFLSLVKRDPGGGLEALSGSEHIKITFNGFATINQHFDASGAGTGTCEVVVKCLQPSGGVPLVVTTDTNLA